MYKSEYDSFIINLLYSIEPIEFMAFMKKFQAELTEEEKMNLCRVLVRGTNAFMFGKMNTVLRILFEQFPKLRNDIFHFLIWNCSSAVNGKIPAIKAYRALTSKSLLESKTEIEILQSYLSAQDTSFTYQWCKNLILDKNLSAYGLISKKQIKDLFEEIKHHNNQMKEAVFGSSEFPMEA